MWQAAPVEIRTITDEEVVAFRESLMQTFGFDTHDDPDGAERVRALVDYKQAWAAFDGSTIAATAATFRDLSIGIPGGDTLPIAALTMVTVRPTHRRRGLLRELMRRHLDDARERGLAASGLWASEAQIYGRFGYGVAAEHDAITVGDTTRVTVGERPFDNVEWVEEPRARELLPDIYTRATAQRPGALRRDAAWWHHRRFLESPWARHGASLRRHVVTTRDGQPTGFVSYRHRPQESLTPGGTVEIIELHGIDARAEATLWHFVLSMDLFKQVTWWSAPTDEPLPLIVSDPRRIERKRADNIWLRIEDVPAALRARRYATDGVLRFSVDGAAYELAVTDSRASCVPASRSDLEIDRSALASLYLGGFAATRLARAGLVRGDDRAIATADRLFAWPIAPWCPEVF
jgi:predicted acetyltransferase